MMCIIGIRLCTFPLFTALDRDAEIELLANLIEETDGTKVGLEEVGNSQLDIEELGNEESLPLIENQGYTNNQKICIHSHAHNIIMHVILQQVLMNNLVQGSGFQTKTQKQ